MFDDGGLSEQFVRTGDGYYFKFTAANGGTYTGALGENTPPGRHHVLLEENRHKPGTLRAILCGDAVEAVTFYNADEVPFDFRRAVPVWRVALEDGTYIYVGRDTGASEAVRTRWWRWFDFAWGLHIMDLSEREDNSHAILISFAALSLLGALFGCVLMFRRRKARIQAPTA